MSKTTDHFEAEHLSADLRGRSVRGAAMMFASNFGRIVIGIGSAAVLGRLLTPDDFGVVAMVAAVAAMFDRLRTAGLGAPTVQSATITHQQVCNLFWLNIAFGMLMTIAFAAMAPLLDWFYGDPRLVTLTLAMSLTFLIKAVPVQHGALLRRQMRLRAIAAVELLSELAAVLAAVGAAFIGWGYWSLVVLNLGMLTARMIGTIAASGWVPGRPRRGAGTRRLVVFGGQVTMSAFVQSLVDRIDRILIGKVVGADALGFYTRAFFVLVIPTNRFHGSLRNVTVPALSRIQDDPNRYRFFYGQATQLTALVMVPAVVLAFVAAEPLALTLLGEQWHGSVPIIRAMAPAALYMAIWPVLSWVYFSLGRGQHLLRWTIIESIVSLIGIIVGVRWGAVGVAAGFSIARVALWPASVWFAFNGTFMRWRDLYSALWRPATASTVAGAAALLATLLWLEATTPPFTLLVQVIVFSAAYGSVIVVLPGGIAMIREMLALRQELRLSSLRQREKRAARRAAQAESYDDNDS